MAANGLLEKTVAFAVCHFLYGSAKGILAEIAACENFAGTDCAFWWGGAYGKNPQLRMFV